MIAYCDCFSGVSGDMLLGALVDAGLPISTLSAELAKLGLGDAFTLQHEEVKRGTMRATKLRVILKHEKYHRSYTLSELTDLLHSSDLSERVKKQSLQIFQRLTQAEARAHSTPLEAVKFHELAIPDLIVDVVGTVIGLDWFHVETLYTSPLPTGQGQAENSHSLMGILPLPSPTTMELMSQVKAHIRPVATHLELVTPTGAAIITTLAKFELPAIQLHCVGNGAGGHKLPWPNVFRLWLGEPI
ncbi:MAG: LarC family nickel insertion protein [Anaerolineae bacterium]|nr:LarC family nickel insertion protein [Anaerolineae bacterium]